MTTLFDLVESDDAAGLIVALLALLLAALAHKLRR